MTWIRNTTAWQAVIYSHGFILPAWLVYLAMWPTYMMLAAVVVNKALTTTVSIAFLDVVSSHVALATLQEEKTALIWCSLRRSKWYCSGQLVPCRSSLHFRNVWSLIGRIVKRCWAEHSHDLMTLEGRQASLFRSWSSNWWGLLLQIYTFDSGIVMTGV